MTSDANIPLLPLTRLAAGLPAITAAVGHSMTEAIAVCLENCGHAQGALLAVGGEHNAVYRLYWSDTSEQVRRAHNDLEEATEYGACGIAILLVGELLGFTVIERARKGSGFDYWLGDPDELPFRSKARLEVSGIMQGTESEIQARVRQKLTQVERSSGVLPAYVVVVEFGEPRARIRKR